MQGFFHFLDPAPILQLINQAGRYVERGPAETDPSLKQIIPQVMLVSESKVFIHRIPTTGGEARLHKLIPIFLGGHCEESDNQDIEATAWREFLEELGLPEDTDPGTYKKTFFGIVNDETNEVSQVHVGLVWIFEGGAAAAKEAQDDGVSEGKFLSLDEVDALIPEMTYWSKLAWPELRRYLESQSPNSMGFPKESIQMGGSPQPVNPALDADQHGSDQQ